MQSTTSSYLKTIASYNLSVFQKNLESGKQILPVLDHLWKWTDLAICLLSDVDGVIVCSPSLPTLYFNDLFKKERYAQYSEKIMDYDRQIDVTQDGRSFEGIAKCLFKAGLTLDDHLESCEVAGREAKLTPYTHDAIEQLHEIRPFIGMGFNSASWTESLTFLASYKRLLVSTISASWLEFHNNKFSGRYFFNYGPNKFNSGLKSLRQLGCSPDLKINRRKVEFITLSDTISSDRYLGNFAALGGMSLWMDKSRQLKAELETPGIVEINIPETSNDMRILSSCVKHFYRARIIAARTSPQQLVEAVASVKELINFGEECLKISDRDIFNKSIQKFMTLSQKSLMLLTRFDFPRYSTGIDFMHSQLLYQSDLEKRKEAVSKILESYTQNFPEGLMEESWLKKLT